MKRGAALLALCLALPTSAAQAATRCTVRAPRDGSLVQLYRYDANAYPNAYFGPAEVLGDASEVEPTGGGEGYLNAGAFLLNRWTQLVMQDVQPRGVYTSHLTQPTEIEPPIGGAIPGAGEPDYYPYGPYEYDPYLTGTQWLVVWFDVGGRGDTLPPGLSAQVSWDFRIPGGCTPVWTGTGVMHLDHRSFPGAQTMTPVAGLSDWMERVTAQPYDLVLGAMQHGTFTDPRHALRTNDACTDRLFFRTPNQAYKEARDGIGGFVDRGGEVAFRYWYRCLFPNVNISVVGVDFPEF